MNRQCMELSRFQVESLVIAELRLRNPNSLAISVDFIPSNEGFCHCWWVEPGDSKTITTVGNTAFPIGKRGL
jgi:hypothetical protein